jgi:hypothetical protein
VKTADYNSSMSHVERENVTTQTSMAPVLIYRLSNALSEKLDKDGATVAYPFVYFDSLS